MDDKVKIIKEFEDTDFYAKWAYLDDPNPDARWFWGISSDGELCYRCDNYRDDDFITAGKWYFVLGRVRLPIGMGTMIKIVETFKPILPFL